jgi:hypothetical protein
VIVQDIDKGRESLRGRKVMRGGVGERERDPIEKIASFFKEEMTSCGETETVRERARRVSK